ncbi:hypothetical protein BUALT_Bualt11G0007200 [Buddleja alternifolia]|uniref:Uncharacterized protein n=1 Tax=Buddleja alternifolia TaxID=168488 RepID=A0AAV6WSV7_9LAMI|nr:hypothetical protein BUALT_Bualt11G0007200 [Buddleja alternifolia]
MPPKLAPPLTCSISILSQSTLFLLSPSIVPVPSITTSTMPPTPLITWGKPTSPSPMTHIKPSPHNHYNLLHLVPGLRLNIPIRCARPTPNQTDASFRYLLTYVVIRQGNIANSIADAFSGPRANF